jgi:hypothetical protein
MVAKGGCLCSLSPPGYVQGLGQSLLNMALEVNVYLSKKLIENYRKRKVFLEQIKAAVDSERALYCFFYGVTPELKQVPSKKNPEQTFGVFSANIENLDHLIIREAPGVE